MSIPTIAEAASVDRGEETIAGRVDQGVPRTAACDRGNVARIRAADRGSRDGRRESGRNGDHEGTDRAGRCTAFRSD